jgi:hypothetical protein
MRQKMGQLVKLIPRAPAVKSGLTKATPIREWCECREAVRRAERAYLNAEKSRAVRDEDWAAVERVLAGLLPRCKGAEEMKEGSRRELERQVTRLIIEMQDVVVAMLQARRYDTARERGKAAHEGKIRWETLQAERRHWANIKRRLTMWAITINTGERSKAQAYMLDVAAKRKRENEEAKYRHKRTRGYLPRGVKAQSEMATPLPKACKRANAKAQAKLKRLSRKNAGRVRLDTGKESVSRLQEAARWRRGHDIPGGGFEVQFDRGWGDESRWVTWLRVRPSGLLQHAGRPDNAAGWGLYAARGFGAGDSIGTVTGQELRDIGKIGGTELRAALRDLRAQERGHHAIQVNGWVVDGAGAASGVQYANSAAGIRGHADNAVFKRTGTLWADAPIEAGQEILVPWGDYWPKYPQQRERDGDDGQDEDGDDNASGSENDAVRPEPEAERATAAVVAAYTAAEEEAAEEHELREETGRRRDEEQRAQEEQRRKRNAREEERRWEEAKVMIVQRRQQEKRRRKENNADQTGKQQRTCSGTSQTAPARATTTAGPSSTASMSGVKRRVPDIWSSNGKANYMRRILATDAPT